MLAQLDWVMASVHTSFDEDPTERVLHAMESPHVDCIGHLTSRRIASATRPRSRSRRWSRPRSRPAPSWRSTRSRTGSTSATRTLGWPARPGCARRLERRALDEGAPLRRSRRRAGAARLADEGADPQHAAVAGDPEAAQVSFREDGAAAVDWVASYLERVRDFPVLAQVEPGELRSRLPAAPPERAEPFANVLRDLDDVLLPAVTHWQSPRFFAYFANTGSEPGVLAELLAAGLNQVGILWRTSPALQELEEVTLDWLAQLLGLPEGLHGHIEDTASTGTMVGARRGAAGEARRARRRHARSMRTRRSRRRAGCSSSSCGRRRSTTRSGCAPDALDLDGRVRGRRHDRDDLDELGRSRAGDRGRARGGGRLAACRRGLCRLGGGLPGAARVVRRLGAGRLGRRQPAQVAADADGLLDLLDATARRLARRLQPRAGVPARQRGGGEPLRVQPGARAPLPGAQALGGAALLRPRGAAGADPRGDPPGRALRGLGARGAGLGAVARRGRSRSSASAATARTRRTRRCSSASTRRARSSSRTRG